MQDSRRQHYDFAHYYLPQTAFRDLSAGFTIFCGPDADVLLKSVWRALDNQLSEEERMEPEGLGYFVRRHGDFVISVVELPPPVAVPEAFFAALAFGPIRNGAVDGSLSLRYFTLELGSDPSEQMEYTVLGEWTADGAHLNLGYGRNRTRRRSFTECAASSVGRRTRLRTRASFAASGTRWEGEDAARTQGGRDGRSGDIGDGCRRSDRRL